MLPGGKELDRIPGPDLAGFKILTGYPDRFLAAQKSSPIRFLAGYPPRVPGFRGGKGPRDTENTGGTQVSRYPV